MDRILVVRDPLSFIEKGAFGKNPSLVVCVITVWRLLLLEKKVSDLFPNPENLPESRSSQPLFDPL